MVGRSLQKLCPNFRDYGFNRPTKVQSAKVICIKNYSENEYFRPSIGHAIFKRACSLRSDFRMFLSHLNDEQLDELANDIYILVTECVANVEYAAKVRF